MRRFAFVSVPSLLLLVGCSTATIYTAPDFASHKASHESIALLPFVVNIDKTNMGKDITKEDVQALEVKQGETFQRELYTQFLQYVQRGQIDVEIQDINKTNALLQRQMESASSARVAAALTKDDICDILQVDAVVSGSMTLSKPMGNAAAIASAFLLNFSAATNEGNISMQIHESSDGKLMWSYDHEVQGGLLSSPDALAEHLMKDVARSFPYRSK